MDDRSAEVAGPIFTGRLGKMRKMVGNRVFIGSICIGHKLPLATMENFELLRKFGLGLVLVE